MHLPVGRQVSASRSAAEIPHPAVFYHCHSDEGQNLGLSSNL